MRKALYVFVLSLLFLPIYGQQAERIINFHSAILIDTTGRVQVTEQIKVYAAGNEIKRGIVRQIPVYRKNVNGNRTKVDIHVISVQCNGQGAKFRSEHENENLVIYVGDKDVYLDPGIYEYAITYESRGHIGFFDTYDELYWNVTGNDSDLAIEKASATVTLPDGIQAINTACYTGKYGSTDTDCNVDNRGSQQIFSVSRPLKSREGLSIAVSFPSDIIKRPPPPGKIKLLWEACKQYICALVGLLIAGCFFFFTWRKVGKDPEQPVAIPTFKPPHDWLPATSRYLYKRKYDNKVFTATLVGMAVKGAILIEYEKKQYRLKKGTSTQGLSHEEQQVYDILFAASETLTVTDNNHSRFSKAITNLENAIEEKWDIKDYFLKNWKYIVFGGVITIAVMIAYAVLTGAGSVFAMLFISPFIVVGPAVIVMAFKSKQKLGCALVFFVVWGIIFSFGSLMAAGAMLSGIHWVSAVFLLLMPISYAVYIYLIKAPTVLGAKTTAELEGFRMYLKTAEEHRLNMLTPPEKTPELFEKLLPYAIALDVDNEWCKKFDSVLRPLNYEPQWYQGSGPFVFTNFGHSFASSFNSSISSARTDPSPPSSSSSSGSRSWSSGSSGGGFSGGGGGGGRVGGW